jgi:N-formylglutamate amidohydrolase
MRQIFQQYDVNLRRKIARINIHHCLYQLLYDFHKKRRLKLYHPLRYYHMLF